MQRHQFSKTATSRPKWFREEIEAGNIVLSVGSYCLLRLADGSYDRVESGDFIERDDKGNLTHYRPQTATKNEDSDNEENTTV